MFKKIELIPYSNSGFLAKKSKEDIMSEENLQKVVVKNIYKIGGSIFLVKSISSSFSLDKEKAIKIKFKKILFIISLQLLNAIQKECLSFPISIIRKFLNLRKKILFNFTKKANFTSKEIFSDEFSSKDDIFSSLSLQNKDLFEQIQNSKHLDLTLKKSCSNNYFLYAALASIDIGNDGQILIIVPHKFLVDEVISTLLNYFSEKIVAKFESGMSSAQKVINDCFYKKVKIIVGTRSSCFLPFNNLKRIIIHEEHDEALNEDIYSSGNLRTPNINYNIIHSGKSMVYSCLSIAKCLSEVQKVKLLRVSNSPSISTEFDLRNNLSKSICFSKKFSKDQNFSQIKLPFIKNLSSNEFLHENTLAEIKNAISQKKKTMIIINRAGFAPGFCPKCKMIAFCKNCSSACNFYSDLKKFICSRCNAFYSKIVCKKHNLDCSPAKFIFGIEKFKDVLIKKYSLNSDQVLCITGTELNQNREQIINQIENKELMLIISTASVAKVINLNSIDLTIIPFLDSFLFNSFFSLEICYNFLHSLIQKSSSNALLIFQYKNDLLLNEIFSKEKLIDRDQFVEKELASRKLLRIFPYFNLISINICSAHIHEDCLKKFVDILLKILQKPNEKLPALLEIMSQPMLVKKVLNLTRYAFFVRAEKSFSQLPEFIHQLKINVIRKASQEDKIKMKKFIFLTFDLNSSQIDISSSLSLNQDDLFYFY